MGRVVYAADLFCGAGGTSTGLMQACASLGLDLELLAVNHWERAVQTHAANHPGAQHYCARIDQLEPRKVCPRGLDLLIASPECTHHSRARGGRPMNDQSRASGWDVLRWVEHLLPRAVLLENVIEWQDWGPIGSNGRPLKSRKGETFAAFLAGLASLGYRVETRVLNAADYGDATTRRRLFVQARRGRGPIVWPTPSHAAEPSPMFGGPRWRAAREVIDWTLPGRSIFGRERPLAEATLRRIAEGLRRFGSAQLAEAFLVHLKGTGGARSLDLPVPSLQAGGEHVAVVRPFIVPFLGERAGQRPRTRSVDDPLQSPTTSNPIGLAEPFLLSQDGRGAPRHVGEPAPTIVSRGAVSLVEPFLVEYHGNGQPRPVTRPVPTVTTRDRVGLVQPARLDVLFRMLQPGELAAAMGFPSGYAFHGNRGEVVRQIGNAVAVNTARALCAAALGVAA